MDEGEKEEKAEEIVEEEEENELKAWKNASQEFDWEFDEEDFLLSDPMMLLEIASYEEMTSFAPSEITPRPPWEMTSRPHSEMTPLPPSEITPLPPSERTSLPPTLLLKEPYSRPDSPDSGIDAGELESVV